MASKTIRAGLCEPAPPADTVRLADDDPALRVLRPLGYQVSRWLQAMSALGNRHAKQRLPSPLLEFLDHWMPGPINESFGATGSLGNEPFCLKLGRSADGRPSQLIDGPPPVTDAKWWALLHLPALRDFWTAELRASHYAHLLEIVPKAWCMDPAPLPPGSVIAGLNLPDWRHLPDFCIEGATFALQRPGKDAVTLWPTLPDKIWLAEIDAALAEGGAVLVEQRVRQQWLLANYGRREDEIVLLNAFATN